MKAVIGVIEPETQQATMSEQERLKKRNVSCRLAIRRSKDAPNDETVPDRLQTAMSKHAQNDECIAANAQSNHYRIKHAEDAHRLRNRRQVAGILPEELLYVFACGVHGTLSEMRWTISIQRSTYNTIISMNMRPFMNGSLPQAYRISARTRAQISLNTALCTV